MNNKTSLNRLAFSATGHCLTGCAIGEVLGLIIADALGWGNFASIALAVVLAFFFGYSLTMLPLLRAQVALATAIPLAFASDTLSITVMEIIDNLIMLLIPGAMDAGPLDLLSGGGACYSVRGGLSGQPLPDSSGQGARGGPRVPPRRS
jgi:uncharacterized membrane protein YjjP (DUF1212 family)